VVSLDIFSTEGVEEKPRAQNCYGLRNYNRKQKNKRKAKKKKKNKAKKANNATQRKKHPSLQTLTSSNQVARYTSALVQFFDVPCAKPQVVLTKANIFVRCLTQDSSDTKHNFITNIYER
jgi:hypothetical protein